MELHQSTSERNKEIVRALWDAAQAADFAKIERTYDENVTYHGPAGEERQGRSAAIEVTRTFRNAFPDLTVQLEQLVAEGDFVVSRVRLSGTHKGELNDIAPTEKKIDLKWVMNMVCIKNEKVIEEWEMYDRSDLMKQLGVAR